MRFIHISDLHLGRRLYEYSLIEDQKHVLWQVLDAVKEHKTDAVLIAGDIYDKSIPSTEAMELFDEFLAKLKELGQQILIISGNHDSVERVSFGAQFFKESGIHISRAYEGMTSVVGFRDEFGEVYVHLVPFVKPAAVRRYHEEENITDYNSALSAVVAHMDIDKSKRNVCMVHQFITGAARSDSEEAFLGGLDNVDYEVFDDFDYVALGHIHKPQSMGRKCVRYSGSPLKYSIDEANQRKSMSVVELREKGCVDILEVPFKPLRDVRKIEGTYLELTDRNNYIDTATDDYVSVVLTDEEDIPDAFRRLKVIYGNILKLEYNNKRSSVRRSVVNAAQIKEKTYSEYVKELYELQNNTAISDEQMKLVEKYWQQQND